MVVVGRIRSMISTWFHRRFSFTSLGNVVAAAGIVAVATGLVSMALGQDRNWDLRNYHLYSAYAYLTDRVGLDLAPSGLQSYFPPLLDVPYYWLSMHLPSALTAFLMGLWHGLNFILVAGIAWEGLENDSRRMIRAPLLGMAGMLSAAFLSELGNTMGDASTAPFVLAALYLSVRCKGAMPWGQGMLAGLCMGLAVGLKLTNSVYALALAASMLTNDGPWRQRLKAVSIVATTGVLSCAILTGDWFHHMWSTFGNPLLPQFNAWFQSSLASQTLVLDTRWLPESIAEGIAWPILMTLEPGRVGESGIQQIVWPLLQGLMIFWAFKALMRLRNRNEPTLRLNPVQCQVLMFVGASFVIWMLAFSIHRYLVAAEMLAPLAIWLIAQQAFTENTAAKIGKSTVAACALVAVLCWNTWGHAGLTDSPFRIEQPESVDAPSATVLMTGQEPQSWLLPFLPAQYRYVGVGTGFPEGPAYLSRARSIWEAVPDRIFVIVPAVEDKKQQRVERINQMLSRYGFGTDCGIARWVAKRFRLGVAARRSDGGLSVVCDLVLPVGARVDVAAEDKRMREEAANILARYSLRLHSESCRRKRAWIGSDSLSYQWCRVSL